MAYHIGLINTYSKKELTKRQIIRASKFESEINVFEGATSKKCLICGKDIKGFCKSHSLPEFVLKNISSNGMVKTGKSFQSDSHLDKTGIGNTLTFYCVCCKCDREFFQNYEHEEVFFAKLTDVAVNEIAVKNYLRYLYKQQREKCRYKKLLKESKGLEESQFCSNQLFLAEMNIDDTKKKIDKTIKGKHKHLFYVIDEIDLDYRVKLAYQGFVTISYGFDGVVNNIYNYNLVNKIQQLGICIFPNSKGTKILLFCEEGSTKLKSFYRTYKTLSLEQKLYVLNYILLLYEEEWVISGEFDKKLNKETLILINQRVDTIQEMDKPLTIDDNLLIEAIRDVYELKTEGNIFNFLEK